MSLLSRPAVADTLARLFAATVNPAPKRAVRFTEVPGRTSEVSIPTRYGAITRSTYDRICGHVIRATAHGGPNEERDDQ